MTRYNEWSPLHNRSWHSITNRAQYTTNHYLIRTRYTISTRQTDDILITYTYRLVTTQDNRPSDNHDKTPSDTDSCYNLTQRSQVSIKTSLWSTGPGESDCLCSQASQTVSPRVRHFYSQASQTFCIPRRVRLSPKESDFSCHRESLTVSSGESDCLGHQESQIASPGELDCLRHQESQTVCVTRRVRIFVTRKHRLCHQDRQTASPGESDCVTRTDRLHHHESQTVCVTRRSQIKS